MQRYNKGMCLDDPNYRLDECRLDECRLEYIKKVIL
jgi:hypothetical protein